MWTKTVEGMDVQAVRAGAAAAVEHARSGAGPAFLQTLTYRFVGHSRSDPGAYRKAGELEEMRARDPLAVERARLLDSGEADESELEALEARVAERIDEVVARSLDAPFPDARAAVFSEYRS